MGIQEQSCFVFKTVKTRDVILPVFEAIANETLADEVLGEIDSKIDHVHPREDPGIKY